MVAFDSKDAHNPRDKARKYNKNFTSKNQNAGIRFD